MNITEISQVWLPLTAAALVTASFSLGVSMLTLLSGHLRGIEQSTTRVQKLSASYISGFFLALLSSVIGSIYILSNLDFAHSGEFWSILSGVAVGVGLAVMLFYYRWDKNGTKLWLPRRMAEYLYARTKATRHSFEAFLLGVGALFAELIFIAAPIIIAANLALGLQRGQQIAAILIYVLIALMPLLILHIFNASGQRISSFIKWREKNKKFLQIIAGTLLIILGFYLFIYKVM